MVLRETEFNTSFDGEYYIIRLSDLLTEVGNNDKLEWVSDVAV